MKKIFTILVAASAVFFSCKDSNKKESSSAASNETTSLKSSGLYFDYTVDGKEMHINPDDISGSYNVTGNKKVFKIFAGKPEEPNVMLVIPHDMSQPSSTPNGSPDYDMEITQGSVSLQNYPEKNYTTNSFNTIYTEMSVVSPDAVIINSTTKDGDKARIIEGTFNTTTYATKDSKDPKDTNHKVSGKFRIKHEFSSMNGGAF